MHLKYIFWSKICLINFNHKYRPKNLKFVKLSNSPFYLVYKSTIMFQTPQDSKHKPKYNFSETSQKQRTSCRTIFKSKRISKKPFRKRFSLEDSNEVIEKDQAKAATTPISSKINKNIPRSSLPPMKNVDSVFTKVGECSKLSFINTPFKTYGKRKRSEIETVEIKNAKKELRPVTKIVTELYDPKLERSDYYKCLREGEVSSVKLKVVGSDLGIDEDCLTDDEQILNCRLPLSSQLVEAIFNVNVEVQ
ncbi:unnamed protein product [Blepharisma stoltei]|uniref:Ribosomal protein L9 n=1 Tax=Blepharisma stoltei TaxID=1481888 RepID=A0AAU9IK85_9CILI|nr:unnamed protein product [Blepharisma stoltei]